MKDTQPSGLNKRPARICEVYGLFFPAEKLRSHAVFQFRNLFCESGLTNMEPARRPRKVQLLRKNDSRLHQFELITRHMCLPYRSRWEEYRQVADES
jgi:hypothetical protein